MHFTVKWICSDIFSGDNLCQLNGPKISDSAVDTSFTRTRTIASCNFRAKHQLWCQCSLPRRPVWVKKPSTQSPHQQQQLSSPTRNVSRSLLLFSKDQLANPPTVNPSLLTLPSELHLEIFEFLDGVPEDSAYLGLTSKTLYPLSFAPHEKEKLFRIGTNCARPTKRPKQSSWS